MMGINSSLCKPPVCLSQLLMLSVGSNASVFGHGLKTHHMLMQVLLPQLEALNADIAVLSADTDSERRKQEATSREVAELKDKLHQVTCCAVLQPYCFHHRLLLFMVIRP